MESEPESVSFRENDRTVETAMIIEIKENIKRLNILSPTYLKYIRGMSTDKMFELIMLYNIVMVNVNEVI